MQAMKLLSAPTSPYGARVLIQAWEKSLDLAIEYPPPGTNIAQHAALNPFGKLPILIVGDSFVIESAAIQEYLEDVFPSPSLRGADALATARMRAAVRAIDLYLFPAIGAFRGKAPGDAALADAFAALRQTVDRLCRLFDGDGHIVGERLTLADCTLVPAWYYVERFLGLHRQDSLRASRPVLQRWWETMTRHASVTRVLEALERAAPRKV